MAEINIDRIGGSGGTPLPLGNLKVDNPLNPALQIVKDTGGNASALLISTTDVTNFGGGAITNNTAFGSDALTANTTGSSNTAFGNLSLGANDTGSDNTAIGREALAVNNSGDFNTSVGSFALTSNTIGNDNTAVGRNALFDVQTGSDNTAIGFNTGRGIITGSNNTILGANVTGLSATLADNIIIADGSGNRRINVDSSGNVGIGTNTPSARLQIQGDGTNDIARFFNGDPIKTVFISNRGEIGAKSEFAGDGGFVGYSGNFLTQVFALKRNSAAGLAVQSLSNIGFSVNGANSVSSYEMELTDTGNLIIGGSSGTARLAVKGSGTTSATTSLLVQNSAGAQNFKVADNGSVQIGTFNFVSSTVIENTTTRLVATTGGVAVNSSYAFANSSSILDVASTTKGFLPPRMTTAQKLAIVTPAAGLMVYDTDLNKLCLYTTAWEIITSA
jgi:hypothetical protein